MAISSFRFNHIMQNWFFATVMNKSYQIQITPFSLRMPITWHRFRVLFMCLSYVYLLLFFVCFACISRPHYTCYFSILILFYERLPKPHQRFWIWEVVKCHKSYKRFGFFLVFILFYFFLMFCVFFVFRVWIVFLGLFDNLAMGKLNSREKRHDQFNCLLFEAIPS